MMRVFSAVMFILLVTSMVTLAFNVQPVKASGTIYIRADGSIDPPTAPISTVDNVTYVLTGNINDSIVVERNNIIVEGVGYTVTGSGYGIDLTNRSNVTIRNVAINRGILLDSSSNNNLSGNNVTGAREPGFTGIINLVRSSNNTILRNNITSGGIWLQSSSDNNTVLENIITNGSGIWLSAWQNESSRNTIVGNNITNSTTGIELSGSNNTVSGNIMNGNEVNFEVSGDYSSHSIDVSNLVNGKPVYYLVNQKDLMIDPVTYPEIGYLALINCTNATVDSLTLTNQTFPIVKTQHSRIANSNMTNVGVQILESSNITIYGNSKTGDNINEGIYVFGSDKITISKNNLANSWDAIAFEASSNNIVSENNFVDNGRGISLWDGAENITIYENNLTNNTDCGLYSVGYGASAHVYHNSFTNNTVQVEYFSGNLVLDDGYPSGGNHWSDYTGVDEKSGPNQDQPGGDGIGDTPYIVDSNNQDRYPLMESWIPPEHELVVSLTPLSFLKLGNPTLIDASVVNQGSNDEIGIEFSLFINETMADSANILLLQPDNSDTLEYLWDPTVEGTYNITAYAHPVPGETYMGNNRVSEFVTVSTKIVVPDNFPTIQAAVDAAQSGDTILVKEGTYYEHVAINKSVTLIGDDRERTIIDGSSDGTVMNITASHVNVTGFTIQKGGYWPGCGIHVSSSFNNISNNIIRECDYFYALELVNSSNTIISRNFITANVDAAVELFNSSNNVLSKNRITDNGDGIDLSGNDEYSSSNNIIFGNNITNNSVMDISLYRSPGNIISQNNIANSPIGIHIIDDPSSNITILENNITNNTIGILFSSNSRNNTIYHNNFVNNTQQVNTPYSASVWDDGYPSGGNYWSDYNGTDANHDGIGDTPYQIDSFYNNADNYPLMTAYVIPEFPTFLILPLLVLATLVPVIFFRREHITIK